MLSYEDACGETSLYVPWLIRTYDPHELAEQVCDILGTGGFAVGPALAGALADVGPVDLADFIAANFSFETDDAPWLDYCAAVYIGPLEASLTADQRNGARASWRQLS